jgi:hypothetical protein
MVKVGAHVHPADFAIRLADDPHDGVSLLLPVIGPARVLDLKHLRVIALAFLEVGIARLELHIQALPGGAALVVLELDLAINLVVAVGLAAIDLPGLDHDESRVMHDHQLKVLVVNHRRSASRAVPGGTCSTGTRKPSDESPGYSLRPCRAMEPRAFRPTPSVAALARSPY